MGVYDAGKLEAAKKRRGRLKSNDRLLKLDVPSPLLSQPFVNEGWYQSSKHGEK
jgi:hypothetical protein